MDELELKLPDDVINNVPDDRSGLITYLSNYFDKVIERYNERFQKRVSGLMGQPLSRYEKAILKDMLMDLAIGKLQSNSPTDV